MRWLAAAAVALTPLLASCVDEAVGPLSRARQPASISLSTADVRLDDGDTLQLFVNLADQHDNVFADVPRGVELDWTSDETDVVEVEADGRIIATGPGTTTVRVQTNNGLSAEASVHVRQVARQVVLVDGGNQQGMPNSPLADSILLRVVDRHGNGVADAEVRLRVMSGGGSLAAGHAVSDAQGFVRFAWVLGPFAGAQAMQAFAPGAGDPIVIAATVTQLVFAELSMPSIVGGGGTLAGSIRFDSDLALTGIGAAHVVVSWDPARLRLQPGSVSSGDYARSVHWFDDTAGELHVLSTDPDMDQGVRAIATLAFDVVGAAGTTATVELDVLELIGTGFLDMTGAALPSDLDVSIE